MHQTGLLSTWQINRAVNQIFQLLLYRLTVNCRGQRPIERVKVIMMIYKRQTMQKVQGWVIMCARFSLFRNARLPLPSRCHISLWSQRGSEWVNLFLLHAVCSRAARAHLIFIFKELDETGKCRFRRVPHFTHSLKNRNKKMKRTAPGTIH